jgi:hypothetical protein
MSIQQQIGLTMTVAGKERKYIGRFLGFIKDSEFNAMIQFPDKVPTRLESKATQPIMEIAAKFNEIVGHRLIMTVRKVDDRNVLKKTLFITEGLEVINSVAKGTGKDKDVGKVTFKSTSEEIIEVEEIE